MKKVLLVIALVAGSFISSNAQAPEGFQFGGGLRLSLPIGDFSKLSTLGIGGELQGEYGFSENLSGVVTTGYSSFLGKTLNVLGTSVKVDATGYIPILAGVRYYPSNNFFVGAQIGYGLFTGSGSSDGGFNYQPQVGYNAEKFQVALNYNGVSKNGGTLSHIGLAGIYKF
jgi:hypothetical protein